LAREIIIDMIYWTRQLYDYPVIQTEFDQDIMFSNPGTGTSAGTDVSTQVDEKDVSPDRGSGKQK